MCSQSVQGSYRSTRLRTERSRYCKHLKILKGPLPLFILFYFFFFCKSDPEEHEASGSAGEARVTGREENSNSLPVTFRRVVRRDDGRTWPGSGVTGVAGTLGQPIRLPTRLPTGLPTRPPTGLPTRRVPVRDDASRAVLYRWWDDSTANVSRGRRRSRSMDLRRRRRSKCGWWPSSG